MIHDHDAPPDILGWCVVLSLLLASASAIALTVLLVRVLIT